MGNWLRLTGAEILFQALVYDLLLELGVINCGSFLDINEIDDFIERSMT
jgi:hypothetical protein